MTEAAFFQHEHCCERGAAGPALVRALNLVCCTAILPGHAIGMATEHEVIIMVSCHHTRTYMELTFT